MLDNLADAIFYMDDYNTFKDIQIKKYANNKKYSVKKDSPEWDMIVELIKEYWCDLLATGYINNKNKKEKENIFKSLEIIFPYTSIPVSWIDGITYVDFSSFRVK